MDVRQLQMGNSSSSSDEEYQKMSLLECINTEVTSPHWPTMVAKTYCRAVDQDRKMLMKALSQNVELMWFGRTIDGSRNVVQFLNLIAPYSNHRSIVAMEEKSEFSESEESMEIDMEQSNTTPSETENIKTLSTNGPEHMETSNMKNMSTSGQVHMESETTVENMKYQSTSGQVHMESEMKHQATSGQVHMETENINNLSANEQVHMESAKLFLENLRKRHATDELPFNELRTERNNQKNLENSSLVSNEDENLISKYGLLEISGPENSFELKVNREDQDMTPEEANKMEDGLKNEENQAEKSNNALENQELQPEKLENGLGNEEIQSKKLENGFGNQQIQSEKLENGLGNQEIQSENLETALEKQVITQKRVHFQTGDEITKEITSEKDCHMNKGTNNNNPTLENSTNFFTPAPVKHKQPINVDEILKKAGKEEKKEEEKVKPRVIKLRAQLFLGKEARPGYKRRIWEKKLKAIFITFTDEIKFIEYIGDSCARNLLHDFNKLDVDDE